MKEGQETSCESSGQERKEIKGWQRKTKLISRELITYKKL